MKQSSDPCWTNVYNIARAVKENEEKDELIDSCSVTINLLNF